MGAPAHPVASLPHPRRARRPGLRGAHPRGETWGTLGPAHGQTRGTGPAAAHVQVIGRAHPGRTVGRRQTGPRARVGAGVGLLPRPRGAQAVRRKDAPPRGRNVGHARRCAGAGMGNRRPGLGEHAHPGAWACAPCALCGARSAMRRRRRPPGNRLPRWGSRRTRANRRAHPAQHAHPVRRSARPTAHPRSGPRPPHGSSSHPGHSGPPGHFLRLRSPRRPYLWARTCRAVTPTGWAVLSDSLTP
jgi:hypothetical protein